MRNSDPFSDLIRSIEENLQREGDDWIPPDDQSPREPGEPGVNPRRWLWILIPLLIFLFFNRILGFMTDYVWYESLGFTSVFTTRVYASLGLFVVAALFFWLFLAINVLLARRMEPHGLVDTPVQQVADAFGVRVTPVILGAGAILAFFIGASASANWETLLLFLNQADFGQMDPIFMRDASFFVFTLPVWEALRGWLTFMVLVTLVATAVVYGIGWRGWRIRTRVLVHLSVLGALILLLIAWQYRLDAFQLVYSARGAVFGAGYTDVRAQLPAFNVLFFITLIAAVLLVVAAFLRGAWRAIVVVLVVWAAVAMLAGNVYPGLVQRFQVSPNELTLERPFIEHNIAFTRYAFDLDDIEVRNFDASQELTAEALLDEAPTVRNIRLWDYRPLLQTYNQVQALRQYYEFNDIDIDRYEIDGETRQMMVSARELVPERLNENAQTWVNQRLVYTHGYGVAASPVAQITRDGLPEFYLKDLPTQGVIDVTRPQIYFGERTNSYVIGRTATPEFDYPRGEGNVTTQFDADTGINMTLWHRVLFALRFADINILLNQDISSDSQLLWQRNIAERIYEVAPFLEFDRDPYIVVSRDGQLFWFQDAYTVTDRFPYSEPYGRINYIRNPVKVVTNAYDGTMTFYVVDENEPILQAYRRIFPVLFRPLSEMPADLLDNVRYPNDLFSVQAEVYRTYHMTDATEFYNKEDMWAWPEELFDNEPQRMEPYYVLMELPDSEDLDFVQILPFTPANRENMIAWLAAQNDPEKYGEKIVYEFGKDSLYFGPQQVEARIDQDPVISAQLSLWNQQGSNVIRGNLLVIPVSGSLLYVEPLYLQAANGKIPELKRVILATVDRVVMAENLGLALAGLFGGDVLADEALAELAGNVPVDALPVPTDITTGGSDLTGVSLENLVILANEQYSAAQNALRDGDWTGYGRQIDALQGTLEQLMEMTGVELPAAEELVPATDGESDAPADGETEAASDDSGG
jgi:uncharacterized membrane protein (UPF0182 family)